MQRSTTSTSSHILTKYSRSHPSPSASSLDETQNAAEVEWQHFTNPTIRLVLDIKKTSSGDLESVRLRVLWYMYSGGTFGHENTEPVVFEDIDLFIFSSLENHQSSNGQGLPLKAVHRDNVVGIRYLHPPVVLPGKTPIYRRFQVTFDSSQSANQFIDAIRPVCPCKTNNAVTPKSNRAGTMATGHGAPGTNASLRRQSTASTSFAKKRAEPGATSKTPRPTVLHPAAFTPAPSTSSDTNIPSSDSGISFSSLPMNTSSSASTTPHNIRTHALRGPGTSGMPTPPSLSQVSSSSLPASSPPRPSSAARDDVLMPPPPLPSHFRSSQHEQQGTDSVDGSVARPVDRQAFLDSLRDTPVLYDLTRSELEKLVTEVIREPGFLKLLEKLDTLWQVKGALGI